MPHHFTKDTVEASAYCSTCGKMTMHAVWGGRIDRCKNDHSRPTAKKGIMKTDEALELRKQMKKFLDDRAGKPVEVSGMWLGDFIGVPVEVGAIGARFNFKDETVWLPYCTAMKLADVAP